MRRLVITGSPLRATGRTRRRSSWQRLMCVPGANWLHLMNEDTADSLCECISTGNYKIHGRVRRTCYRSSRPRISPRSSRMQPPASNNRYKYSQLLVVAGVLPANPISLCLAIIGGVFWPILAAFAQDVAPTPQTAVPAGGTIEQVILTTEEVIVTGSNIPTAEEVGPNPVDTYRQVDIERLGVRNATDLVQ